MPIVYRWIQLNSWIHIKLIINYSWIHVINEFIYNCSNRNQQLILAGPSSQNRTDRLCVFRPSFRVKGRSKLWYTETSGGSGVWQMAASGPQAWREVRFALRNRVTNSSVESAHLVLFLAYKWLETSHQEKARQCQRGTMISLFRCHHCQVHWRLLAGQWCL